MPEAPYLKQDFQPLACCWAPTCLRVGKPWGKHMTTQRTSLSLRAGSLPAPYCHNSNGTPQGLAPGFLPALSSHSCCRILLGCGPWCLCYNLPLLASRKAFCYCWENQRYSLFLFHTSTWWKRHGAWGAAAFLGPVMVFTFNKFSEIIFHVI